MADRPLSGGNWSEGPDLLMDAWTDTNATMGDVLTDLGFSS
jgi:hypothetical protein